MEEKIFKPRYAPGFWFEMCMVGFWLIIGGAFYVQAGQIISWWLPALLALAGLMLWSLAGMVKRLRFQQNAFVIEYYLRPRREIEYQEITDIGEQAVWTRNYHLSLAHMSNRTELLPITSALKKTGQINEARLEGKLKKSEEVAKTAATIAIFGTLIIIMTLPFILTFWFPMIKFELSALVEGSFLGIFLLAFAILKIRDLRGPKP